ncbi:6-phospho-3-hexuloisomerase [Salinifilum aidingensis]
MTTDPLELIRDEIAGVLAGTDREAVDRFATEIDAASRVFVSGAGRSGFMASAFAMRLVHLGLTAHVVGEATAPVVRPGDVLVAVSGSGGTAGTVRAAEDAAGRGARVLAVTTDEDSSLAALARDVLLVPAATKHRRAGEAATAQPLSSLFDQCTHVLFDAVCLRLAARRDVDNAAAKAAHVSGE